MFKSLLQTLKTDFRVNIAFFYCVIFRKVEVYKNILKSSWTISTNFSFNASRKYYNRFENTLRIRLSTRIGKCIHTVFL